MKLGELMHGMVNRIKQKNIFLTKYVKNEAGRLVQAVFLFFFFKKVSYEVKMSGLQISFNIFR